jgi:hypothetical protein
MGFYQNFVDVVEYNRCKYYPIFANPRGEILNKTKVYKLHATKILYTFEGKYRSKLAKHVMNFLNKYFRICTLTRV